MTFTKEELWQRFQKYYIEFPEIGFAIDLSRMNFSEDFFDSMKERMEKTFKAMAELEKGGIANPDEKRMVGHYWLRNPALAATKTIQNEIEQTISEIKIFAREIHEGKICGEKGDFKNLLVVGIGGSALGPQFVSHALGHPLTDKLAIYFFDNTDPDGMDKVLANFITELGQTLCLVISKSGATKETRNGMLEAEAAYKAAGLNFARHAVAITGLNSELDKFALQNNWIRNFPMWDWIGGRTSEFSAVGMLPARLQGFNIDKMLAGAKACDELTRIATIEKNPAALLALTWFYIGNGKGEKDMVIFPYKDRLEMFSRYLQQLVMKSLGKEKDLLGTILRQGMTVYGNKGSTDQHAYVQQLRDGVLNFFVTFIEVLRDRDEPSIQVEPNTTSGDFLNGFFLGTRSALYENGRESVTLTLQEVSDFSIGALIALFERAVGFYAFLINVNAYDQPGVEGGKKAASKVIALQEKILSYLKEKKGHALTCSQLASGLGAHDEFETVFKKCEHLAANARLEKIQSKISLENLYKIV
ncbi:MAG: glucose-6-phosphate isomerase [Verrucomicrobiota bacterium]|nr:glucose-6-phosphate isomerase [Verrucomicrobiota bacterium]